jgi:glycosyltransferase involved in cell wall biosynthesis
MKILFVSHYSELYGANRSLLALIDSLIELYSIKCAMLLPKKGELAKELDKRGIEYLITPFTYCTNVYSQKWGGRLKFLRNFLENKRLKKERKIINSAAINFLSRKIQKQDFNIIYSNSSVIDIGFKLSKVLNIPHVYHVREFAFEHYNFLPDSGYKEYYKTFKESQLVIFISESLKAYFEKKTQLNSKVIYVGVMSKIEAELLPVTTINKNPKEPFVFSLVGLISEKKGQKIALKALAQLQKVGYNCKLIIAGGGNSKPIEKIIKDFHLEKNVELLGYIKNSSEIYAKSDVVLMCSEYEAFGRVTVEAMLHSKPVIGFNSGATPELITDKIEGLIADLNEHDLAEKMKILMNNPEFGIQMGRRGREKALQKFLVEDKALKIYEELQKIAANGNARK